MRFLLRSACAPVCLVLFLLSAGCQPVREDRSINWSEDGQSVSFQHAGEGVFLADKDTGKLTKIFQPGTNVIAVGSPLWSPAGKRVIFTTARAAVKGQTATIWPFQGTTPDPAGNIFTQQEIIYTCYLYEEKPGGAAGTPVKLFEATCDHVSYVAANLAVRWHPQGERVLFVQRGADQRHSLYAFDLATKKSWQVLPHTVDALIFDWSPDGKRLACVLADRQQPTQDGIWIGQADGDWWHVPQSAALAHSELPSTLEQLRATRPAWTADGSRFAFAAWVAGPTDKDPGQHFLRLATVADRHVKTLAEGAEPYHDLHWDAAGERLGVVRGTDAATLHLVGKDGAWPEAVNRRPVRQFIGWNATGKRLAYVGPDGPLPEGADWALLFVPDEHGRDAVYMAAGDGSDADREVFWGMRVTFPQWSPKEDKLSLWFTFTPKYHSALSLLLGGGLRRGDPAAVFDPATGKISWLAVNPQEKAQVGHYCLMKRDYAEAWHWYEDAAKDWPAPQPVKLDLMTFLTPDGLPRLLTPQDVRFFEYYCLTKLGRPEAAKAKLDEFRKAFPPHIQTSNDPNVPANFPELETELRKEFAPDGLLTALVRDFYCAEVFLSLDAAADAETYFRDELKAATTDAARLSSTLVLSQILLLENKRLEYADLTTDVLMPLMLQYPLDPKPAAPPSGNIASAPLVAQFGGGLAVAPLFAPSFLKGIPEKNVEALVERWLALRDKANTETNRWQCDRMLWAAYERLGRDKELREVAKRLEGAGPGTLPISNRNVEKDIEELRTLLRTAARNR